jgi:hypothetical protein
VRSFALAIPIRIELPNEYRLIEIATTIAAKITDKRIKTILYKLVRLIAPIGCMIKQSQKLIVGVGSGA